MSTIEEFRARARSWLELMAPVYGQQARLGLTAEEDLAVGRRYQKAKYEAGFAGINWPVDIGGQGLGNLEKVAFDAEELPLGMPTQYFSISWACRSRS